jgi:hypothetical protein
MPTPAAGGIILAAHMLRARPKRFYDETTGTVAASSSGVAVPGLSITFTTETDGAELEMVWFIRATQTAAASGAMSARPLVTGPSSFSQQPTDFAIVQWGTSTATNIATPGNAYVMTLGSAGAYTVTMLATTTTNQTIAGYTSITCVLQEQFA